MIQAVVERRHLIKTDIVDPPLRSLSPGGHNHFPGKVDALNLVNVRRDRQAHFPGGTAEIEHYMGLSQQRFVRATLCSRAGLGFPTLSS